MNRPARGLTLVVLGTALIPAVLAVSGEPSSKPAAARVVLRVAGEVPAPLELTAEALARLPRQSVVARDPMGKESKFAGVPVIEVLKRAGVKFGPDLRGAALTYYLVVEATDGYQAVFSLPELDPDFTDRIVLLTDERDGQPVEPSEGPLRIVAVGEKRHSRWVRNVVTLRIAKA